MKEKITRFMIGSFMLILGNILADILLKLTDPRVSVR